MLVTTDKHEVAIIWVVALIGACTLYTVYHINYTTKYKENRSVKVMYNPKGDVLGFTSSLGYQ